MGASQAAARLASRLSSDDRAVGPRLVQSAGVAELGLECYWSGGQTWAAVVIAGRAHSR